MDAEEDFQFSGTHSKGDERGKGPIDFGMISWRKILTEFSGLSDGGDIQLDVSSKEVQGTSSSSGLATGTPCLVESWTPPSSFQRR